ncbi:MAG: SRPBCC family protein [Myxococcales bacterium]|nr:SRPBCC family protein [Myxococcales bacterium]
MDTPIPLSLRVIPRRRLLLFNIVDDPRYEGAEIQEFDDPEQGRGLAVLLFRRDRKVDVYREAGVRLVRDEFAVGAGVGEFVEAAMGRRRFELREDGAHVDVALTDVHGDRVEIMIEEEDPRARHPETLLAPVSADIDEPRALLLVYLGGFDFVHRAGRFDVRVGGEAREVATMSVPIDLAWVYMARYSSRPVVVEFAGGAPEVPRPLPTADALPPGQGAELTADGAISALTAEAAGHRARIPFTPPLPDLRRLAGAAEGAWRIDIDDDAEVVAGVYRVQRSGDEVEVAVDVTRGWHPHGQKPSFAVLTAVMRFFRTWPKSYRWRGRVRLGGDAPTVCGRWIRDAHGDVQLIGTPHRFAIERRMAVAPAALWARLGDFAGGGDPDVVLEEAGDPKNHGVGAIRRVQVDGKTFRERLVDLQPGRGLTYELLEGAPVADYFGTATVDAADDGGALLRWEVRFTPKIPGTAWFVEWVARRTLAKVLDRVEAEVAADTVGADET